MDDLKRVADREFVFGFDLCPAVADGFDFAHKLATVRGRAAVVLVALRRAAFQKARGVATVGQTLQLGDEFGVERATRHRVVNGATVHLRGAADVVQAFGAAFDLERIDANLDQFFDQFDRAQVFAVHDVSAVLVFHDGHELAGATCFFDQVDLVGSGVALAIARSGEAFLSAFTFGLEAEVFLHFDGLNFAGIVFF